MKCSIILSAITLSFSSFVMVSHASVPSTQLHPFATLAGHWVGKVTTSKGQVGQLSQNISTNGNYTGSISFNGKVTNIKGKMYVFYKKYTNGISESHAVGKKLNVICAWELNNKNQLKKTCDAHKYVFNIKETLHKIS